MSGYPVQFEVTSPPRFERIQLLVRILLSAVLGWLGFTAGWFVGALYGVLPLVAAIAISTHGPERYLREDAPKIWRGLEGLLGVWAFNAILVDTFPTETARPVRGVIRFTGTPTVGSALLRFITSIPSGLVLSLLWCVGWLLWIVAAFAVLFTESVPQSLLASPRGILRWNARLVAYHASLVEEYPPFSVDTGVDETTRIGLEHRV